LVIEGEDLNKLFGANDENLRSIEDILKVRASARGNVVRFEGEAGPVGRAERVLTQLSQLHAEALTLTPPEVRAACRLVAENPDYELRAFFVEGMVRVTPKRVVSPKSFNQKVYVETIRLRDIVFGIGPAGTGKTYLAMAMAVQALAERSKKRIILARPAVEAGEKLGFLPGDLFEKVNPYLRPLYDALHDMMAFDKASKLVQRGVIEVAPLAFMRGRTLNDSFVILDEAQNTTSEQMKMFLTRLGFGSRAVITGDVTQIDLPEGRTSGLVESAQILSKVEGLSFIYFTERDVVRHHLVREIVKAYDKFDEKKAGRPATD
jgi:phosphate starvation-inducible PhoH-like protein